MQSPGKRLSAFAVFKAKKDATPKLQGVSSRTRRASGDSSAQSKPKASTPIAGFLKQGQGQLRKLRNSARSKKSKRTVKRSESSRARIQRATDIEDHRHTRSSPAYPDITRDTQEVGRRGSSQKKRKSPYITPTDNTRSMKAARAQEPYQPISKRLKYEESGCHDAGSSTGLKDTSLTRDSLQYGKDVFAWLISPFKVEDFFRNIFERKPLLLKRHNQTYFSDIFSSEELHNILKKNDLQFTRNIDVTTYTDGKRETHNPVGRAHPQVVWDYYKNGCSVRILNPQSYSTRVWQHLAALQEFFGCFVGANIYMTPPGSQGFAPHYDDIEAFVLQLEGKKRWKLYNQRSPAEVLPRNSSSNFTDADIGQPILDTTLEAGDLLYFPRGVIHQASTTSDTHSLHITVSACQKNTWGDLMKLVLNRALDVAQEENIEFRKSLPTNYLNYMGVAHLDLDDERRHQFKKKIGDLFSKLQKAATIDTAVDEMSLEFMHNSLPPLLEEAEESCSVFGSDVSCKNGVVKGLVHIGEDTLVRLIRRNILRLVPDTEEKALVYHSAENSRVFKEKDPQFFEIPAETAPAVEHLIHSYPDYVPVSSLPVTAEGEDETLDAQQDLAQVLYEKGLLVTKEKLESSLLAPADYGNKVVIHQAR